MDKKNNKKFMIFSSIALLIVFFVSMGIGAIIGATTKKDPDYIKIVINNKIYNDSEIDLGNDRTSDETKALMLEAQFLSASLFGSLNIEELNNENNYNYIFNTQSENLSWNLPYKLGQSEDSTSKIRDAFIATKFLSETQDTSVYDYLNTLSQTATNPFEMAILNWQIWNIAKEAGKNPLEITGFDLVNDEIFSGDIIIIFDEDNLPIKVSVLKAISQTLTKDYTYQVDVLLDMYTYAYLWQDASQNAYDYILTRELAYSKPSLTASATFDLSTATLNPELYDLSLLTAPDKESSPEINMTNSNDWNSIYSDLHGLNEEGLAIKPSILEDDSKFDNQVGETGFKGFDGITFGTTAGTNIDSDWTDIENTWYFDSEVDQGTSLTKSGEYTNTNILDSANLYVKKDTTNTLETGIITDVVNDPTNPGFVIPEGSATIYAYNQLVPYVFEEVKDNSSNPTIMDNATFSLFAKGDSNSGLKPATMGEEGSEYIFDRWFGEDSLFGEIYVVEALINHDTSLEEEAKIYWQNKGFYIELSGDYEDSLIGFIPDAFIKND